MARKTYQHKRGTTLSLAGTATLPVGTWTARCQVKQNVNDDLTLIEELAVTLEAVVPAPAAGEPTHNVRIESAAAASGDWPSGRLQCDVRFEDDSVPPVVINSETFDINVSQGVTSAAP